MKKVALLPLVLLISVPCGLRAEDVLTRIQEVSPSFLTEMNGMFYFSSYDSVNGSALWQSDGSREKTKVVKSFATDGAKELPRGLVNGDGTLYFCAYEADSGWELWKSDGTEGGTTMVTDLYPGVDDGVSDIYCSLVPLAGKIFFPGIDAAHGAALWKTDGTAANTSMVYDYQPSSIWGIPNYLFAMGTTLYVYTNDGVHGYEWWRCDGPAYDSSTMVLDIYPGIWGGVSVDSSREPVILNGYFYFQGDDGTNGYELWRSDGTGGGTEMVKDINPSGNGSPYSLTLAGNTVFFEGNDGVNGRELWKSDGSAVGTVMVKDINSAGDSGPDNLKAVGDDLYFAADDGTHGIELWKSDGSAGGTVLVKDINPAGDGDPRYFTEVNGVVYFRADDGSTGDELWMTDGTVGNGTLVADIVEGSGSSWPGNLFAFDNSLFFRATYDPVVTEGEGDGLYRYGAKITVPTADFYWPMVLPAIISR